MVKGLESLGRLSPTELAHTLMIQREALRTAAEYRKTLAAEVHAYECRYGVSSDDVHAAIDRGELEETHDDAKWIMAYESLRAMCD
mgnify:CR=1 FL=1